MSHRQIRSSFVFLVLSIVSTNPVRAEDPPAAPPAAPYTREQLDAPPKRQLTFERSDKPYSMKLFRADPKLLEQKVVAIVSLLARPMKEEPGPQLNPWPTFWYRDNNSSEPALNAIYAERQKPPLKFLEAHHFDPFLSQSSRRSSAPGWSIAAYSESFRILLNNQPAEQLPPLEATAFFLSNDVDRGFLIGARREAGGAFADDDSFFEFRILAPSNERAEALAAGLLRILDVSVSRPLRLSLWDERKALVDIWNKLQGEIAKSKTEVAAYKAQLDALQDINSEGLNEVRNQRMLLTADITGAKARSEACDKLLAGQLSASRKEQVQNLKDVADVELAGMNAKLLAIDNLVSQIRKRVSAELWLKNLKETLGANSYRALSCASAIRNTDVQFEQFGPLQLSKDRVLLQPIDWRETGK